MPRKRGSGRVSKTVNSSANTVADALKRGSGRGRRGRPPLNAKANRMEADIVVGQKIEETNSAAAAAPAFTSMVARTVSESEPGDLPGYLHKKFKKVAAPIQNDAQVQGSPVTAESVTNVAALPSAPELTPSVKCEKNGEEAVTAVVATQAAEEENESGKKGTGKYVCPICQHACAKPSVLEKHLRAHTNERPYPCTPCGFAFKTKSNLYKHCKSRAHVLKLESLGQTAPTMTDICLSGAEEGATDEDDSEDLAALSDASSTSQLSHPQKPGQHTPFKHSVASMLNHATEATPPKVTAPDVVHKETRPPTGAPDLSTKAATPDKKLYKPKFRGVGNEETNAVITSSSQISQSVPTTVATNVANDFENLSCATWARVTPCSSSSSASSSSSLTPPIPSSSFSLSVTSSAAAVASSAAMIARSLPSPGSLQARISQIISDNEAIVETRDPVWAKRFMRQTSKDKSISRALVLTATPSGPHEAAKHNRERSFSFSVARLEESRSSPVIQYSGKNAPPSQGHSIHNTLSVSEDLHRKRCHSEGPVASQTAALAASPAKIARFDLNRPESYPGADLSNAIMAASGASYNPKPSQGSIIKDLLLMNRANPLPRDETDHAARAASLPAPVSSYGDYQKYYRSNSVSSSSAGGQVKATSTESEGGVLNLSISRLSALPVRPPSGQNSTNTNNVSLIPLHEQRNSVLVANLGSNWPSLRGHEDPNASQPSKSASLQLFGGQVQICDGNEKRILRIDASGVTPDEKTGEQPKVAYNTSSTLLVSIANSGLNSGGGIVQVQENVAVRSSAAGQVGPNVKPASRHFFLPATNFDPSLSIIPVTKAVPHPPEVPGMPGPASQHLIPEITVQSPPPCTTTPERAAISTVVGSSTATVTSTTTEGGSKFLRPNTLPLKPGTFLPRKVSMTGMDHLGTPTLSGPGMTLVSPETPRPRKSYSQNYLNGHAYTYLGLKCSTRVYYCCLSRPQPMYVLQSCDQKLSMYSQWQTRPIPADASPCGLGPTQVMSLYDSRNRPRNSTVAQSNNPTPLVLTHSSYWLHRDRVDRAIAKEAEGRSLVSGLPGNPQVPLSNSVELSVNSAESVVKKEEDAAEKSSDAGEIQSVLPKRVRIFAGGFKSNEDYTYVRGRGRGRYVCEECGIRCKKPSMLKKHIRTHTDVRPYTCRQCCFSFKTKGNLTKHMKSKAHHKKCTDLGIVPVPTAVEDCNIDEESVAKQESLRKLKAQLGEGDSDNDFDDEEDEDDDEEDEEDDEEEDQFEDADETEREVAHSLLDLQSACSLPDALQNAKAAADAGLIAPLGIKPNTYPYVGGPELAQSFRDTLSDAKDTTFTTTASTTVVSSSTSFPRYYFPDKSPRLDETTTLSVSNPNIPEPTLTSSLPSSSPSLSVSAPVTTPTVSAPATLGLTTSGQNDMLQMYLTEKAVKEVEIKRKQWNEILAPADVNSRLVEGAESVSDAATSHVAASVALSGPNPNLVSEAGKISNSGLVPFPKVEVTSNEGLGSNAMEVCEEMQVPTDMMRAQTSVPLVIAEGTSGKPRAEFLLPSSAAMVPTAYRVTDDGKTACSICNKVFSKPSQLRLHINIHYFERPFRCDACAVSFRTKGHLQKHKRSVSHFNKVNMNLTFGTPSTENPRPFKCSDCLIAFRIHGHLAKHLRSKMHIMKLECLGKLPFGTYAEMERSGMNLNEIDTTDCQNSLESLQSLAHRLYRQDPSKLQQWQAEVHRNRTVSGSSEDLDEVDDGDVEAEAEDGEDSDGAPCPEPLPDPCPDIERSLEHRSKVWPVNHVHSRENEDKVPSAPSKPMHYMLDHANGFANSRLVSVSNLTQPAMSSSSPQRNAIVENHAHLKPSAFSVSPNPGSSVIRVPGSDVTASHSRGPPPRTQSALEIRQLVSKPRYEYPPEMDKASACLCSACGEVCADNEAFRKHVLLKHPPQAPVPSNSSSGVNSTSTSTCTSTLGSQSNTLSVPQSFMSSASSSTSASPATTSVATLWNPLTHKPSKPPDNWYSTYQRSENSRVRLSLDFPAPTSFSLNLSRVPSDVNYAEVNPTWVKEQQTMLAYMAARGGALSPRSQMMRNESFPSVAVATTSVSCDLCGKQGMNPLELKQHLSSHAQPRPFVCEFCDAGFTTRQSLENHILFHKRQSLS